MCGLEDVSEMSDMEVDLKSLSTNVDWSGEKCRHEELRQITVIQSKNILFINVLEKQEDHWEQEWKNIAKKWIASQESLLEQKRPGQLVSATNLQLQIMFATRIMW